MTKHKRALFYDIPRHEVIEGEDKTLIDLLKLHYDKATTLSLKGSKKHTRRARMIDQLLCEMCTNTTD